VSSVPILVLLACLPVQAPQARPETVEVVSIDGSVNPELVPQYRAWAHAFRLLAGGPPGLGLPNGLREFVSPAEEALILREANQLKKMEAGCVERALKAREPLTRLEAAGTPLKDRLATAREVDAAIFAVDLSCRWEALHARDRLLEVLSLDAGSALLRYVELKKRGLRFDVPKNGLERFRQPY
jgi:hypothetical protein